MGGLLFGYEGMQALAMSIALLGCLLGATMAGFLADKYGRKKLLIFSAFIFFVSSWATGVSDTVHHKECIITDINSTRSVD